MDCAGAAGTSVSESKTSSWKSSSKICAYFPLGLSFISTVTVSTVICGSRKRSTLRVLRNHFWGGSGGKAPSGICSQKSVIGVNASSCALADFNPLIFSKPFQIRERKSMPLFAMIRKEVPVTVENMVPRPPVERKKPISTKALHMKTKSQKF